MCLPVFKEIVPLYNKTLAYHTHNKKAILMMSLLE